MCEVERLWSYFSILSTICALVTGTVLDLTDICRGKGVGVIEPHPFDCQAYFICGTIPIIQYCDEGLHFDAVRGLCNWPEEAKCKLMSAADDSVIPTDLSPPIPLISHPIFIAIDVDTGRPTHPMDKYNPDHIECRHFGAYFLPHPNSCRRYYICAYGHLHTHKCGRGTAWNYEREECELDAESRCYSRSVRGTDIDANNPYINDENIEQFNNLVISGGTTATPTTTLPSTVCFVVDTTIVTGGPTESPWYPTGTGTGATGTTFNPTGTYHTATATATATVKATPPTPTSGRVDGLSPGLRCPKNGEAYLPNADDCRKYFICIAGRPVATICPYGLYWDKDSEFCDVAKNVKCYRKQ